MAGAGVGAYASDLDRSRELTEKGATSFLDADVQAYMNPYVEGALEPAARALRRETDRNVSLRGAEAAAAGAFGGSRSALRQSESERLGNEAMSDLYARGYQSAFESAASRFDADRAAARAGAEQYRALSDQGQQQMERDIQTLLATGSHRRQLQQANLDFDYQQFVEARDWDLTNLQPLLATLSSVPYGYTESGETQQKGGGIGQVIGAGVTIAGAVMGGRNGGGFFGGSSSGGGGGGGNYISLPPPGNSSYRPTFPEYSYGNASGLEQTPPPFYYG